MWMNLRGCKNKMRIMNKKLQGNRILSVIGLLTIIGILAYVAFADVIINASTGEVNATTVNAPTGRSGIVVASAGAPSIFRLQADYVCNGVDDQIEIQQAVDAGAGTEITFIGDDFVVNCSAVGQNATVITPSYTNLRSGFWGAKITLADNANCDMFHPVDGGKYIKFENLQLYGNAANQAGGSDAFEAAPGHAMHSDIYFQNTLISHFSGDGIRVTNDAAWHLHLNDNTFEYFGNATYVGYAIYVQSPDFFRFIVNDNQIEDPIVFGGNSTNPATNSNIFSGNVMTTGNFIPKNCNSILIEGNMFYSAGYGVYPDNSNNITVLGNYFDRGSRGLVLRANDNSSNIHYAGNKYDTTGNRLYKYGTWTGTNVRMEPMTGTATIASGTTSIAVTHDMPEAPTRVYLTPTTDTGGKRYWVSTKGATTFTITIDSSYGSNILFDWRAISGEQGA